MVGDHGGDVHAGVALLGVSAEGIAGEDHRSPASVAGIVAPLGGRGAEV